MLNKIGWFCSKKDWFYLKKKTTLYREADEKKRAEYAEEIAKIPPENIVYLDESGFNRYYFQEKCWSKRGVRVVEKISGMRFKRVNLLCGLNSKFDPLSPKLIDENCNSSNFEAWFEFELLPNLLKTNVIVMDNAINKIPSV